MPILTQGSSGSDVTALQTNLKKLGFDPGGVDGYFGPATTKALMAFQKSKGLADDGKAGPNTMKVLENELSSLGPGSTGSTGTANKPSLLKESDFIEAAKLLDCDVAAIKAVAEVESAGNGFLSDGRLKILFEGHHFYRFTGGSHSESNPTICYKKWTRDYYTKGPNADVRGAGELARLDAAIDLDRIAALKSASYGKFQIMGFNFEVCDFKNVEDFYAAMQISEGEQLKAFCAFIKTNKLDGHLRNHRWADFARGYNGPEYAKNKYDQKLAAAHTKYSK